ncbi:hypothetical protein K488DRAFT_89144 [Vararia minispora EC-137]|uniref:Uncharacterized protein n=1 Tax=Vararia minispora EC-137 TaxID=1314806 RepID=A0ACB8QBA3_9AGAM|nr:hypothetical protein K488DRAFT_89144 [Vararia minispora EC-137]
MASRRRLRAPLPAVQSVPRLDSPTHRRTIDGEIVTRMSSAVEEHTELALCLEPMVRLKGRLRPDKRPDAPQVHYGIGFTVKALYKRGALVRYAQEKGLLEDVGGLDAFHDKAAVVSAMTRAIQHLSWTLNYQLEVVWPYSAKYDLLVSVYTNHDLVFNIMDKRREAKVLDAIREIVGDPDQAPMWYYDLLEPVVKSTDPRVRAGPQPEPDFEVSDPFSVSP